MLGGKNWKPMSWNPATGLAYANTLNMSWPYQIAKQDYKQGEWYLGINFRGVTMPKDEPHGYLRAIDPMTGKSKWQMPWPGQPSMAGTLSTAGGLVFTGAATGEFDGGRRQHRQEAVAVPDRLRDHRPAGDLGAGRQAVRTVVSGAGGVWALLGDERMAAAPPGGSLWTFALHNE